MTAPRIAPLEPPYAPEVEESLLKWMPPGAGVEPLALFRTLMVHPELASRMRPTGAGILGGKALVPPHVREVVIHRTCALTGAEYEWGGPRRRLRAQRRAGAVHRHRQRRRSVLGRRAGGCVPAR